MARLGLARLRDQGESEVVRRRDSCNLGIFVQPTPTCVPGARNKRRDCCAGRRIRETRPGAVFRSSQSDIIKTALMAPTTASGCGWMDSALARFEAGHGHGGRTRGRGLRRFPFEATDDALHIFPYSVEGGKGVACSAPLLPSSVHLPNDVSSSIGGRRARDTRSNRCWLHRRRRRTSSVFRVTHVTRCAVSEW